jgi:hypothetical protein
LFHVEIESERSLPERSIVPRPTGHPSFFPVYSTQPFVAELVAAHSLSALQPTRQQTDKGDLLQDSIVGTHFNGDRNLPLE